MGTKVKPISDVLRDAIKRSEMTVYRLAQESGVSQPVISRFVSGERDLRLETADRLALALGLRLGPEAR